MKKTELGDILEIHKRKASVTGATVKQRSVAADINALFEKYNIKIPSVSRTVVSLIAMAVVGGAIGYIGGTLLAFAVAGVLILTGSALLAFLIWALGVVAFGVAAWFAGGYTGDFIVSGNIDRCYQKCSTVVRGWFSRSEDNVEVALARAPRRVRTA